MSLPGSLFPDISAVLFCVHRRQSGGALLRVNCNCMCSMFYVRVSVYILFVFYLDCILWSFLITRCVMLVFCCCVFDVPSLPPSCASHLFGNIFGEHTVECILYVILVINNYKNNNKAPLGKVSLFSCLVNFKKKPLHSIPSKSPHLACICNYSSIIHSAVLIYNSESETKFPKTCQPRNSFCY